MNHLSMSESLYALYGTYTYASIKHSIFHVLSNRAVYCDVPCRTRCERTFTLTLDR